MWTIAFHNSNNLHITTKKWISDLRVKQKIVQKKADRLDAEIASYKAMKANLSKQIEAKK